MCRILLSFVLAVSLTAVAQAAVLNIADGQPGYASMVQDAALRGEGESSPGNPWVNGNIGNATGFGSHRMYPDVGAATGRGPRRYLTQFNVSSIPAGSTINSATMSLFFQRSGSNAPAITGFKLSRVLPGKDWTEGVGQAPATDGSVTFAWQKAQTAAWATPGATGATDIDLGTSITFDKSGPGISEYVNFDIAAWVQAWVNGTQNNGALLWGGIGNGVDAYYGIVGKEVTDVGGNPRPKLVIDYTPIPEPTAGLLLAASLLLAVRRRQRQEPAL